jgi:DNA-binding HxlR family transcriptional regulator
MDLDEDARILAMLRADVWTPVSLLITVLDKVPERTLRRRLHDLVEEGLVERRGHTNTTEYRLSTSANPA